MQTRVYKLYATGTASTNAASTITFQNNGYIQCILLGLAISAVADANALISELSFASAYLGTTNDTIGPLAQINWENEDAGTAATTVPTASRVVVPGLYIPVVSGDRLYINTAQSGSFTWFTHAYLYVLI